MKDFDVLTDGMKKRRLSDPDVEALVAGRRVDGAPLGLDAMLLTMRERAESGPSVPISGALSEFIIEAHPSAIPADAGRLKTSQRRSWPVAKRAAAVLALVPAKILIGASMAVAAVGGAQAFGVVDVPLLPGPGPSVVTTIPAEPVPSETSDAPAKPVPTTVPSGSTSKAATETHRTIPARPTINEAPVASPPTSPPTLPPQAAVEGAPGCEFGQDTSARPAAVPPTDPCAPGAADGTHNAPPEPAAAADASASVPRNNAANHATPAPAANSGHGSDAGSAVEKASTPNPAQNSGQGRTPPGD